MAENDQPSLRRQDCYTGGSRERGFQGLLKLPIEMGESRFVPLNRAEQVLEESDQWLVGGKSASDEKEPTLRLGLGIYQIETGPGEFRKD